MWKNVAVNLIKAYESQKKQADAHQREQVFDVG